MRGLRQRVRAAREWAIAAMSANLSPRAVGAAVAVGVFIGCLPAFGVHIFMCIAAARWLRLNQGLMYLAANISNPLFVVPLLAAELAVGQWILRGRVEQTELPTSAAAWMSLLGSGGSLLVECLVGSLVVGTVLGGALGGLAMGIAHLRRTPAAETPRDIRATVVEDAPPAG